MPILSKFYGLTVKMYFQQSEHNPPHIIFHKVKGITPLNNFQLFAEFQDGQKKIYDIKPLFEKWDSFSLLKNAPETFKQVKVDKGGYGIVWNDEIDLSCNELYQNGETSEVVINKC